MKKRGISIAAMAIACVFAVTVVVFVSCLYSDYNSGLKAAGAKFEKLSSRAAEASGIYPSGSKEFLNLFNSAVGAPEVYQAVKLEINGKEAYAYPSTQEPQASAFVKSFSTRIVGSDGADIRINASIYTVSPALIYYRARIAFIVILAGTLAAGILLMYIYLGEQEKESVDFREEKIKDEFGESLLDEDESQQEEAESDYGAVGKEKAFDAEDESAPEIEGQNQDAQKTAEKVDYNPLENAYQDQQAQGGAQDSSEQEASSAEPDDELSIKPSEQQGLFSPASGFGWEAYLDARLGSELVRAASSEQDLSLAIIRIPGMTKESDYYGNVCQKILDFFQFKDFIFEFKEDGFAVIVQGKDVDQALSSAEVLHADICGTLSKAGQNIKPMIGISSRSLRLISAERLKNEAEQALLHAAEDPSSPIIAFRVNPEKYRKYISGGQDKEQESEA